MRNILQACTQKTAEEIYQEWQPQRQSSKKSNCALISSLPQKNISSHAISPQPNDGQRKPNIFDKGSFTNQSSSDLLKLVKVACVYL